MEDIKDTDNLLLTIRSAVNVYVIRDLASLDAGGASAPLRTMAYFTQYVVAFPNQYSPCLSNKAKGYATKVLNANLYGMLFDVKSNQPHPWISLFSPKTSTMRIKNEKGWITAGKKLISRGQTIAVAESVTSGMLQHKIGSVPDASEFYQGGITAYNIGQKYKHLVVEPIHAASVNCVSEKVATQMATAVSILFSADWGLGITGYATPVPESGNKTFCFFAISYKGGIKAKGKINTTGKDPEIIQEKYCLDIINRLLRLLSKK